MKQVCSEQILLIRMKHACCCRHDMTPFFRISTKVGAIPIIALWKGKVNPYFPVAFFRRIVMLFSVNFSCRFCKLYLTYLYKKGENTRFSPFDIYSPTALFVSIVKIIFSIEDLPISVFSSPKSITLPPFSHCSQAGSPPGLPYLTKDVR